MKLVVYPLLLGVIFTGCYDDIDSPDRSTSTQYPDWLDLPPIDKTPVDKIDDGNDETKLYFQEVENYIKVCGDKYRPYPEFAYPYYSSSENGCSAKNCQAVPLNIYYMLRDNIGPKWLVLEAFDSPFFVGNPVRTITLPGFNAAEPGVRRAAMLHIEPGQYYLRAWLSDFLDRHPYQYGSPIGVYGAIALAKLLKVDGTRYINVRNCPAIENIHIDQFIEDPTDGPGTGSRMRLLLSSVDNLKIPHHRDLIIALHNSEDFEEIPAYEWRISTENLLVKDRIGQAEFLGPEIELGQFFIRTWIDENDNGFFDVGEAYSVLKRDSELWPLTNKLDHVHKVDLILGYGPKGEYTK